MIKSEYGAPEVVCTVRKVVLVYEFRYRAERRCNATG